MAVDAFSSSYLLNLSQIEFCRGSQKAIIRARIPYNQPLKNNHPRALVWQVQYLPCVLLLEPNTWHVKLLNFQ